MSHQRPLRIDTGMDLILELADGTRIEGRTSNYSVGGFLFNPGQSDQIHDVTVNDRAWITLSLRNGLRRFSCRIAHTSGKGIGLAVHWSEMGVLQVPAQARQGEAAISDEADRRKRIGLRKPMTLILQDGTRIEGWSENLSKGGVFFSTTWTSPPSTGDPALLEMASRGQPIRMACKVAHVNDQGAGLWVDWKTGIARDQDNKEA